MLAFRNARFVPDHAVAPMFRWCAHAPRECALHDCGQVAWVTRWGMHGWVARYLRN